MTLIEKINKQNILKAQNIRWNQNDYKP